MVLAIGIVVDDAIVVLENVERIMHEKHKGAREATIEAMGEVTGPVIAIALVLIGAFVPIAFLGGLAGALYRQFAVTISIAVAISGFVALTLTPALCASILSPESRSTLRVFRWFDKGFSGLTWLYTKGVAGLLRVSVLGALLFVAMVAATGWLWNKTPGSLVPKEDQGYYIAAIYLPDGSSLQRTDALVKKVTALIKQNPANEHVTAFAGMDFIGGGFKNNAATMFVTQTHWDDRKETVDGLLAQITASTDGLGEGKVLVFGPAPIFGIGQSGGFELYLQDRTDAGTKKLAEVAQAFVGELGQAPGLMYAVTFWRSAAPQLYVDVDRERAALLGVSLNDAFDTLSATLGTFYVNDFTKFGRNWQVLMSAEQEHRKTPEDVGRIRVRSHSGEMLPLTAFADVRYSAGPETLDRHGNLPGVKLFGSGLPGVSTGDALQIVDAVAAKSLPPGYSVEWIEASFQEKRSAGTSSLALIMAAILMFLVLAAQYERWTLPLSVMLALPFGTFGALLAVWLRGFTNDVYFQIGLVTLLGLAAKNAILIVEFAVQRMNAGLGKREAILEAARLRFRPILMTSLAFILGVLPLALSHGAGAGARQSVGTGVLGGMLSATFLAIFFVPLFVSWIGGRPRGGKP
jgi:HAE1 family hydrophobic/amphiphilic exporter-1/multidrug efflux pump